MGKTKSAEKAIAKFDARDAVPEFVNEATKAIEAEHAIADSVKRRESYPLHNQLLKEAGDDRSRDLILMARTYLAAGFDCVTTGAMDSDEFSNLLRSLNGALKCYDVAVRDEEMREKSEARAEAARRRARKAELNALLVAPRGGEYRD